MANYKLTDLIDLKTLQTSQDGFSDATGLAAFTVDENGKSVTVTSNPTDFCSKLTKSTRIGSDRCAECDRSGIDKARRTGKVCVYECHAGLMAFCAPIEINGTQLGYIIGGQALTEAPNEAKFRKLALDLGVNHGMYVDAVNKVKILPRKQIEQRANFVQLIANILSEMGAKKQQETSSTTKFLETYSEMAKKIENAETLIRDNSESISKLAVSFDEINKCAEDSAHKVKDTKETVKVIQDIAMNTRILGFNASIEASRAKESGKGFGVIAQEVRNLAEVSKSSADKIEDTIKSIGDSTDLMNETVQKTATGFNAACDSLMEITKLLSELSELSKSLKANNDRYSGKFRN